MRTYLAVFDVPGHMSCFFIFTLVFMLVVEPATEPAAISEIPPQGSGVTVAYPLSPNLVTFAPIRTAW